MAAPPTHWRRRQPDYSLTSSSESGALLQLPLCDAPSKSTHSEARGRAAAATTTTMTSPFQRDGTDCDSNQSSRPFLAHSRSSFACFDCFQGNCCSTFLLLDSSTVNGCNTNGLVIRQATERSQGFRASSRCRRANYYCEAHFDPVVQSSSSSSPSSPSTCALLVFSGG